MKIAILLSGFLLINFERIAETRDISNWQDELSANLDRIEADAERREQEAEAREEQLEAEAEAREEQLEVEAEAREKQLEAEAETREKQMEAEEEARERKFQVELNEIRQKCAKKGFSNETAEYSNRMVTFTNSINGFRHIYVQTYNPATKKVSGSYYRINENNPKAEPICGKLDIESAS